MQNHVKNYGRARASANSLGTTYTLSLPTMGLLRPGFGKFITGLLVLKWLWLALFTGILVENHRYMESTSVGGVRPFGVSLLIAGFDDNGPQLYQVDPSGSYFSWKASVMGKNVSNEKTFLEKRYTDDMELDDAVHTAILTLKEGGLMRVASKDVPRLMTCEMSGLITYIPLFLGELQVVSSSCAHREMTFIW